MHRSVITILLLLFAAACSSQSPGGGDPQIATISLTPPSASIEVGQTQTFTATAEDASGESVNAAFVWASSNPAVASVSNGVATGLSVGTTNVTASANGVTSNAAELTVTEQGSGEAEPTISSFRAEPATIAPGETSTLSWEVSGATSISLAPGIGEVTGSSTSVQPSETTEYTLTATNATGEDTATTTVTVADDGGGGGDGDPPPALHDTIAYVRPDDQNGDQIRLIDPDGTGDRLLWTHGMADPEDVHDIWSMSWKRDATELAFASTHENACSLFHADIFAVGSDGSDYRRVTQAPACAELADYPQGRVEIPVTNPYYDSLLVFIYFQGAPEVKMVSLPPSGSDLVVFENVADFGDGADWLQVATVIQGNNREILFSTAVDVQAGGTVTTAQTTLFPPSIFWEAYAPTWERTGSSLGYSNTSSLWQIDPNPGPLEFGRSLLAEDADEVDVANHLAWGPTPATENQILYYGYEIFGTTGIYLASEGGSTPGDLLLPLDASNPVRGLDWLPDGSGFVYTLTEGDYFGEDRSSNLFVYDFASGEAERITSFVGDFAGLLSVSPDGQRIVFERAAEVDELQQALLEPDVWLIGRDGNGLSLLVEDAHAPAWSP